MGTTWGDLATWDDLDLWWIPNAVQGSGTLTVSSTSDAGGSQVFAHAPGMFGVESFAAAARVAVSPASGVVDLSAFADAQVVSIEVVSASADLAFAAFAAATRTPPADVPAGALRARHR